MLICVEPDPHRQKCRQKDCAVFAFCRASRGVGGSGKWVFEVRQMTGKTRGALAASKELKGSYTVEAAGVMAVVLFTVMILLNQAFHVHAETVGKFALHEEAERERHQIVYRERREIRKQADGKRWGLELTVPVFCPEESLRMWSLVE